MRFDGRYDVNVAYAWHRVATDTRDDPRVSVGYRRKDESLRKAARAADDLQWVTKRGEMGESTTLTAIAATAAGVLTELDWPMPELPADIAGAEGEAAVPVYCASPLRLAWWHSNGAGFAGLCVGPRSVPELALLAWHAYEDWPFLDAWPMADADRYLLALHLGATRLLRLGLTSEQLDRLLTTAGAALLPLRGREEAGRAFLHRVAKACLDQPYGEIERIASGFHSARTDRVHRAWERGFFVPRGLTIIAHDEQPC